MKDHEKFDEFYAQNIVNSSFNLGEKIADNKIVRKILRSFLERFRPKVIVIEESKDVAAMRLEELVGSLQIYELSLPQPKKKNLAL